MSNPVGLIVVALVILAIATVYLIAMDAINRQATAAMARRMIEMKAQIEALEAAAPLRKQ